MYQQTKQILAEYGYYRYEISNYAKVGYECKHNCIYWQRGVWHTTDFVGFGLGASSTVGNWRWKNTESIKRYLLVFQKHNAKLYDSRLTDNSSVGQSVKEEVVRLLDVEQMEEFMFLGLRMMEGVSKQEFMASFAESMDKRYGAALQKWIQLGMMVQSGDIVKLTEQGIDVSNTILSSFV